MNHQGEPDERLMQQVALGQRDPLEVLLRRYASPLLTFIQRMIGDRHRAEELFQEVFLAVWIRRGAYDDREIEWAARKRRAPGLLSSFPGIFTLARSRREA